MKASNSKSTGDAGRKPTLSDVARTAGVSYATADRVINERGNVAQKSVRKVQEAMAELGYVRNVAAANLSRQRTYRLAFLLPKGRNAFFSRVRAHLDGLLGHLIADQVSVDVIEIDAFEVTGLKNSLVGIAHTGYDGLAVVGLQAAEIEEPLRALQEQGTAIVGLVSDLPAQFRAAYVGIDNVAAGRTAGRLLGLSHAGRKGRVQVIAGSLEARDHVDRLSGFREVIGQDYPKIELLEPIMTRDDARLVGAVVQQALTADPKVTAVYNVGAGNSGLVATLERSVRPKRFFCIVHELVPHTHKALSNRQVDLVIDQRPDVEVNRALTILKALIDGRDIPPMQELVPTIYVRDNLPSHIPDTKWNDIKDHD
ncbi:LacI family DNA-binding transcriptional regulator [Granulosicoccus sp. 3-233]|uniref:LacI family DNA-binding transcriptional regulator n=1 Tax=Granulosicoccus sp. 3-233 TaxID=3417969 RepID=UPI003D352F04